MRSRLSLLAIACGALLATQSASADNTAHEVYAKAGLLGIGGGYAYSINERFGLRTDASMASLNRDGTAMPISKPISSVVMPIGFPLRAAFA